ncbi:MAG: hypothetical protein JXQ75_06090 [Phycisphaerae bacterium]|nr:hypothetical protein [Phycisphaerae bacterium]
MRHTEQLVAMVVAGLLAAGCADLHYDNTATVFDQPFHGHDDTLGTIWLKTCYFYPARDYLTLDWAWRALFGDEAWNVTPDGGVADGPFFANRDIRSLSAERVRQGPSTAPAPMGPWRVKKEKDKGVTPGFIGEDGSGRTFVVKLDDPQYAELGTSAEMIGSRLTWLMGYHVPALYLVTIEGTGDGRYDGRRATASLFVSGEVVGGFKFDHYRMRRELRALRLVAAWLNDTDRVDNNTLVAVEDGAATCYMIDFNSCLGSWNGRPKQAWRGWRYAWDVEYQLLGLLTLGLLPALPQAVEIKSPAVGSFDLMAGGGQDGWSGAKCWRPQNPNTAFDRMTTSDAAWMARRMASVSREQLKAIVSSAEFTRSQDAERVLEMLLRRRERILAAYLPDGAADCRDQSRKY